MSNSRSDDPDEGTDASHPAVWHRQRALARKAEPDDESWLDREVREALSDDEDALAELAELAHLAQLARRISVSLAQPRVQLSDAERCDHIEAAVLDRLGLSLPPAVPERPLMSELARLRRLRQKPSRGAARTSLRGHQRRGTPRSKH